MSKKIEANKVNILNLFGSKWYNIPEYQRNYVWNESNVIKMLHDIEEASNSSSSDNEKEFFIGSVIGSNINESAFDLIDGQQRLTTIFLIYAVARELFGKEDNDIKSSCEKFIIQRESSVMDTPESVKIEYKIRSEVNIFIRSKIANKMDFTAIEEGCKNNDITIANICKNALVIRDYFKDKIDFTRGFLKFLTTRVVVVFLSTGDIDDAFRLFQVTNDSGIKLSYSDILKASNLSIIENNEKRKEHARMWEEVEEYFDGNIDKFLNIIRNELATERIKLNLKSEFESLIKNNKIKKGENFFEFVFETYDNYRELFENYKIDDITTYNHIKLMDIGLSSDYWKSALLSYFRKYRSNGLNRFIKLLEKKVSSDWLLGNYYTQRETNILNIIKVIKKSNSWEEVVRDSCFDIDKIEELKSLFSGDIYNTRAGKYLLLKLDISMIDDPLINFAEAKKISIEHIIPQNPNPQSQWTKDFTKDDLQNITHKLGNLILLSINKNSSLGNLDYKYKREKYFKNNILAFQRSSTIYQSSTDTWNMQNFVAQQKSAVDTLTKMYTAKI